MNYLDINSGESVTIAIVLPAERMAQLEDLVVTIINTEYKVSDETLLATLEPNIFLLQLSSNFTRRLTWGRYAINIAADYTDLGVIYADELDSLGLRVVSNAGAFSNDSITPVISATITINIIESQLTQEVTIMNLLRGMSAYEIATSNGFAGTEQEWLDSLVGGGSVGITEQEVVALIDADSLLESKQYSAQFTITGSIASIQHWGTFEQRSANLLNYLTNANKTLANDDYNGAPLWAISTNANGNFFTFPNLADRRLNIEIRITIVCTSPPFDKGAVIHISRGLNGTIVDDRSRSTIFQNFSTINPGAITFNMYTLAQGTADPYYETPNGGFGLVLENVTSSNAYAISKIKLDCIATVQQG